MTALFALALGTFASEDLTCITAGLLISQGRFAALPAILACAAGIYAGDLGLWVIGRVLDCGNGRRGEVLVGGRRWTGSDGWHHFA